MNSSATHSPTDTVVVVGAGPTGLWLACELALAGVHTVVLEQRTERSPHARALGVMPRTLEVLGLRGAADALVAAGRPVPAWHFGLLGHGIRFDVLPTAYPYMLLLPQTTTEAVLEERAIGLGAVVTTGARVTGLEQDGSSATVTYEQGGTQHAIEAALVVGTDGAHSTVRTLAGIPFEGESSSAWGFIGDVFLDAPPAPGTRIVRPDGALIVAPLPDGRYRLTGWDPAHQSPDEELDLETLRSFAHRMAGTDFGAHDPSWLSRFGDANRLAATFRSGRVLLAGDAAHIHWPTGGLGLNAGVQDAMSLGWRAAAVVTGRSADDLLDDYAAERRAYGESLRTSTLAQSALITAADPRMLALRDSMDRMLATPQGNAAIASWVAGIQPETRLPDVRVGAVPVSDPGGESDGASADLRTRFAAGKPVLLVADAQLHATLAAALELGADDVVVERVRFTPSADGSPTPRAVLFRPDGQVAWTSPHDGPLHPDLDDALRAVGLPLVRV